MSSDPRPLYIKPKLSHHKNHYERPRYCTRCGDDHVCICGFCVNCDGCPCQYAMEASANEEAFMEDLTDSDDPEDWDEED